MEKQPCRILRDLIQGSSNLNGAPVVCLASEYLKELFVFVTGARKREVVRSTLSKTLEDSTYRHGMAFAGVMAQVMRAKSFGY